MPITGIIQDWGGFGTDEELYGRRVKVPEYPELEEAQKDAAAANKKILPELQDIATSVNTFNQAEIQRLIKLSMPDLDEINQNISSNILEWSKGNLGKGVEDLVARKTAEQAVAGGYGGSGMHRSLTARDLGLTSLEMTSKALSSAERWTASVRQNQTAPTYDVTSMFISPAQKFAANEAKWQRDLYAETMAAAPNPTMRGEFDSEMAMIGMILSVYGGGGGYQNTYRQPTAGKPYEQGGGGGGGGNNYIFGGSSVSGPSAGGFEGGGVSGGWGYGGGGGTSNLFGGGTPFV